jgi:hypothetical protein
MGRMKGDGPMRILRANNRTLNCQEVLLMEGNELEDVFTKAMIIDLICELVDNLCNRRKEICRYVWL